MFDYWKTRRGLLQRIAEVDERSISRVKNEKLDLLAYAVAQDRFERELLEVQLKILETDKLRSKASKHGFALPPFEDYWDIDETSKKSYLTEAGKALIRQT